MAGGSDYTEVRNEFYKEAQGCILVYDVTNRASFESLESWLEESRKYGAENMVRVGAVPCTGARVIVTALILWPESVFRRRS